MKYSIRQLEVLTSVKAHTIRAWEQRYQLLTPERSETNIRLYTDTELKHLLNVRSLIGSGMKISAISRLSSDEIKDEIDKVINSQQTDDSTGIIIGEAITAICNFDQLTFDRLFASYTKEYGLQKTYFSFLLPLLIRTGLMWNKEDIIPAQEHFLTNLIRQKINASIDALPVSEAPSQTWLLFLPENEKHEIGLLFASYLLKLYSQRVIYLGQDVPYTNLVEVVNQCQPTHVYTFLMRRQLAEEVEKIAGRINVDFPDCVFCVSGDESLMSKILLKTKALFISDVQLLSSLTRSCVNEEK